MKKFWNQVPHYTWLLLLFAVAWNQSVYYGANLIAGKWHHYNIELAIDHKIPFLPWTVSIYFACFLFWGINYFLCASQEKSKAYCFFFADFLAKTVCLIFFIFLPTTNVRPAVEGTGIWAELMRFLYQIDAPSNLFPSIHCLVSWMCCIGVRNRKDIPKGYQIFSCLMAIAVFLSTLTTKQHVIIDVIGGVVLAELSCFIARWIFKKKMGNAK
jgi:membrane-associated phospholipid phosphatase